MTSMRSPLALLAAASSLATAGAAQAQSSVTMYGRLDLAVRVSTHASASGGTLKEVTNGSTSASRLGFRGVEDLGDGFKAIYTLEMGINPDTGTLAQSGKGFGRQAWVGLQGGWGTLTLGRQYSPVYLVVGANEPFGPYNLYEGGFIYDNYTGTPASGSGANRWDNTIQYANAWGGFKGAVIVSAGEGAAGTASVGRKEGFSFGYASGPYNANVGWQKTRNGFGQKNHKVWTLGGSYEFAPFKVNVSYMDHRSDTTEQVNKIWAVGGSYAITPLLDLIGAYYHDSQTAVDGKKTMWTAMLNYRLSKRTNVYITADRGHQDTGYMTNVFDQYKWPKGVENRSTATLGVRHQF